MRDGFKIFDADAHVVEPKNPWERFLDSRSCRADSAFHPTTKFLTIRTAEAGMSV